MTELEWFALTCKALLNRLNPVSDENWVLGVPLSLVADIGDIAENMFMDTPIRCYTDCFIHDLDGFRYSEYDRTFPVTRGYFTDADFEHFRNEWKGFPSRIYRWIAYKSPWDHAETKFVVAQIDLDRPVNEILKSVDEILPEDIKLRISFAPDDEVLNHIARIRKCIEDWILVAPAVLDCVDDDKSVSEGACNSIQRVKKRDSGLRGETSGEGDNSAHAFTPSDYIPEKPSFDLSGTSQKLYNAIWRFADWSDPTNPKSPIENIVLQVWRSSESRYSALGPALSRLNTAILSSGKNVNLTFGIDGEFIEIRYYK